MAAPNVLPWSYSSLSAFETCPKRYHLTKILKQVVEPQTAQTMWGNEVHRALENAVAGTEALPVRFKAYQPIVSKLVKSPGQKHTEGKFGLTASFKPTSFFAKDVWFRGVLDLQIVQPKVATVIDYKGLALDTPLPTPAGWTTMGDIQVGDKLFGGDGRPCTVTGKSSVSLKKCYEIKFDDTSSVVADEDHLWLVNGEVKATSELATCVFNGRKRHLRINLAPPLELPDTKLGIDPYVLGCWLGDGKHTSGEISKPDDEFWTNIEACGYEISHNYSAPDKCRAHTVKGLRTQLREADLLGNKRIPREYLRAGYSQRLALLQGLMDSDGTANPQRKQVIFCTTDSDLSDQVVDLLCSLGQRPTKHTTIGEGFGLVAISYNVSFRPRLGLLPFRLSRKAQRASFSSSTQSNRRVIHSIAPIETVPTQCIAVDSNDNTYLCTKKMIVTHNTGKVKTDGDQMKLFAAATFAQHPYLEQVKTAYVWLAHGKVTSETFTPKDVPVIWQAFTPRVQRMMKALENDRWPPNPSGLCKSYCPVGAKLCEFCGS